jgi:hypothetical protein
MIAIMIIIVPIHIGLNTHIQGQLILPISFKAINKIVNSPAKPIPPFELLSLMLVLLTKLTMFLTSIFAVIFAAVAA